RWGQGEEGILNCVCKREENGTVNPSEDCRKSSRTGNYILHNPALVHFPIPLFLATQERQWKSPKRDPATAHCRVSEKRLRIIDLDEKVVEVTAVMGNKNTNLLKAPDTGLTQKEEGVLTYSATDQWAIQFLQLEKLYHERLLSNLAALQENWESQWKEKNTENSFSAETDPISQKHIETLSQICRTHPSNPESLQEDGEQEKTMNSETGLSSRDTGCQEEAGEEDGEEEEEEETYEEGQEVDEEEEEEEQCEETPEEEEVKVEWPTGVPQASDKDLAKLSHKEGSFSPDGLVSILKRRRASLDGLPPPSDISTKQSSKRKVRFSEPEDGIEQDEVGGDSCLILLLLCLVTVVISIGGTALYCTLVDTYSTICTDFTQNVNFYVMNVRRLLMLD
ncbi:hypothetical protein INR49_004397, partial [Caranx melampygus]